MPGVPPRQGGVPSRQISHRGRKATAAATPGALSRTGNRTLRAALHPGGSEVLAAGMRAISHPRLSGPPLRRLLVLVNAFFVFACESVYAAGH